jgi:hypothetical protein
VSGLYKVAKVEDHSIAILLVENIFVYVDCY